MAYLDDGLNLPIESCGATFNQGNVRRQAHFVNVPSRIKVVKGIEDY